MSYDSCPGAPAPALPDSYVLRTTSLFDGTTLSGPATVHVSRGTVVAVERSGSIPAGAHLVDLGPDSCLMPGLVDAHTHLVLDAGPDPVVSLAAADDDQVLERARTAATTALRAGITTVRDLGDRDFLSLVLRDECLKEPGRGPEILPAGPPITTPGGHCHFLGGTTEGIPALVEAVRERHARGCAVVKVMASGGNLTPGSQPHRSQYAAAEIRAVVDEAHRLGLPVAAHVHATRAVDDALAAGVDTMEHVTFWEEEGTAQAPALLARIAASETFVSLTLGQRGDMTADGFGALRTRLDGIKAIESSLIRLGARVTVGSDAGISPSKPHDVLPRALPDLVDRGMSPADALRAVTSVAAAACGVGDRKGRIRPGFDADFLVVGGDPVADLTAVFDVRAVFRSGVRVR